MFYSNSHSDLHMLSETACTFHNESTTHNMNNPNLQVPNVEKHLIPCCLCRMYLEITHTDFLQFFNSMNFNLNTYICPECVYKNTLTQRIDELTQEVHKLERELNLRNMENSFDKTVDEITAKMSSMNIYNNTNESAGETILRTNPFFTGNLNNGTDILSQSTSETDHFDALNTPDSEMFQSNTFNNRIITIDSSSCSESDISVNQTSNQKRNPSEDPPSSNAPNLKTDCLKTETLVMGDKTLRDVKLCDTKGYTNSNKLLKVVHPKMKVQNATKLTEYLKKKVYPNLKTAIIHVGVNNLKDRQSSSLFTQFEELFSTMKTQNIKLVVSGPIPTPAMKTEIFSRTVDLNLWLTKWTKDNDIMYINNFNLYWAQKDLFEPLGRYLNCQGAQVLLDHILCSVRYMDCVFDEPLHD